MRQRSRPAIPYDPAVIENLLELGGRFFSFSCFQVCFSHEHMLGRGRKYYPASALTALQPALPPIEFGAIPFITFFLEDRP